MFCCVGVPHYHWYHARCLRIPWTIISGVQCDPEHQRILWLSEASHRSVFAEGKTCCQVVTDSGQPGSGWAQPFATQILWASAVSSSDFAPQLVSWSGLPIVRPSQKGSCVVTSCASTQNTQNTTWDYFVIWLVGSLTVDKSWNFNLTFRNCYLLLFRILLLWIRLKKFSAISTTASIRHNK